MSLNIGTKDIIAIGVMVVTVTSTYFMQRSDIRSIKESVEANTMMLNYKISNVPTKEYLDSAYINKDTFKLYLDNFQEDIKSNQQQLQQLENKIDGVVSKIRYSIKKNDI